MSEDAETARQIAELARDDRPLLVLDVDEVVLEFVRPFMGYLNSGDLELRTDSFRLHGNIFERATGVAVEHDRVSVLLDSFFEAQEDWQTVVDGAAEAIGQLGEQAEIVMLTAMPHRHRAKRRALLDRLGLPFPLVTTEAAKGPAIRRLRGAMRRPVAFVDDIPHNLVSVRREVADASLFHLMAFAEFRALLPALPDAVHMAESWPEAHPRIATALGIRA